MCCGQLTICNVGMACTTIGSTWGRGGESMNGSKATLKKKEYQFPPLQGCRCFLEWALTSGIFLAFHQSNLAGIAPVPSHLACKPHKSLKHQHGTPAPYPGAAWGEDIPVKVLLPCLIRLLRALAAGFLSFQIVTALCSQQKPFLPDRHWKQFPRFQICITPWNQPKEIYFPVRVSASAQSS